MYNLGKKEVLDKLDTRETGLSEQEALNRLKIYGPNQLERKNKISPVKIFISQFFDPLVFILIIATIVSFYLNEALDAIVILSILLLNAIFGFTQEYKAEKSIELLQKLSVSQTKVIRDGKMRLISSQNIVPGDIIAFESGDKLSADCRILEVINLSIDEAILTGESNPVNKQILAIGHEAVISDQNNMCFSGTTVASGRGSGIVTATGMKTELGKIADLVQETTSIQTPLQKKLKKLSVTLGVGSIFIALLVFAVGIYKKLDIFEMVLSALSLAVAVVPEGLPAVVTISLAIGVQKMLKKNALIRKLQAVETLGSTSIICSDKTGTITKNEMTVTEIYAQNDLIKVSGGGYDLEGDFFIDKKKIDSSRLYNLLLASASCNNAELPNIGDPTELALLVMARKGDVNRLKQRTHEIPFDSNKKYMITTHKLHHEEVSFLKGAPEIILNFCDYIETKKGVLKLSKQDKTAVEKIHHEMTLRALRVLGVAYKKNGKTIFIGLTGMIDPPRNGIKKAIRIAQKAGIRTIMITGDHKNTAMAVAHQVGIQGDVIEGKDITEKNISQLAVNHSIFARVDPKHKVMILEALQKKGEVVAMTGDGVNDAPALKRADVGVAMSIKGTDVARDASDMVLVDDNYVSIVSAVREGRIIYDNIKKFVRYLLSANTVEIGVILFALLLNLPLPLLPLQLLWVNLVTDGLPALALGVDTPEGNVMKRKPRHKDESILKHTYSFILLGGLIGALIVLGLFYHGLNSEQNIQVENLEIDKELILEEWSYTGSYLDFVSENPLTGNEEQDKINMTKRDLLLKNPRSLSLTLLIVFELFLAFSARSEKSVFSLKRNKWLWGAVVLSVVLHLIIVYTPLSIAFQLTPLHFIEWFWIILLSSIGLVFFEVKKLILKKN